MPVDETRKGSIFKDVVFYLDESIALDARERVSIALNISLVVYQLISSSVFPQSVERIAPK